MVCTGTTSTCVHVFRTPSAKSLPRRRHRRQRTYLTLPHRPPRPTTGAGEHWTECATPKASDHSTFIRLFGVFLVQSNIINTICAGGPDHAKGGRCELLDPSHPSATGRHTNTSFTYIFIPTASYHPTASARIVPTDYRTLRQSA